MCQLPNWSWKSLSPRNANLTATLSGKLSAGSVGVAIWLTPYISCPSTKGHDWGWRTCLSLPACPPRWQWPHLCSHQWQMVFLPDLQKGKDYTYRTACRRCALASSIKCTQADCLFNTSSQMIMSDDRSAYAVCSQLQSGMFWAKSPQGTNWTTTTMDCLDSLLSMRKTSEVTASSQRVMCAASSSRMVEDTNNFLYKDVYAHFETLYRYQLWSALLNPTLLEQHHIELKDLHQEEAIGVIFPSSSTYYDQFHPIHAAQQVAGVQHPRKDHQEIMHHALDHIHQMMITMYGDKFLEPKVFPYIHPFSFGGWYNGCSMDFSDHVKMRLYNVRGWFARDRHYLFYKFNLMSK